MVEIREIIIKATVENKVESQSTQTDALNVSKINVELLLAELARRTKHKNER